MKKFYSLPLLAIVCMSACNKLSIAPSTPECIKKKIESNFGRSDWYVGDVEEYKFQGKLVYAFNPDNRIIADAPTQILTSNCTELCSVGGFGGPLINLCNGGNFFQDAVYVREIWNKYK